MLGSVSQNLILTNRATESKKFKRPPLQVTHPPLSIIRIPSGIETPQLPHLSLTLPPLDSSPCSLAPPFMPF